MGGDAGDMLTVACVKWGTRYGPEYVNVLHDMVERHLTVPHRFTCFTDDPAGVDCETRPIAADMPTWYGKLTLFGHPVPGRVLYFDLDVVIVGNIDGFAEYDGRFCLLKAFNRDWGFNSTIMSIGPDFGHHIWDEFARDPEAAIARCHDEADPPWNHSDQRWIELHVESADYWQDLLPGQVVSYRADCRDGLPPGARVVSFHGHLDPPVAPDPWIRELWRTR
jgi:hypothetical protein